MTKSHYINHAKTLLREACTSWGIKASLTELDNYSAIFTRDAVMTGIVGILLGDEVIINGFVNTIENLKKTQGKQGQIASNLCVENGEISSISFGTLSPKIDSCTWYLIGVGLLCQKGFLNKESYLDSVERVVNLLEALEFNGKHLIYVPKGGNWADEYIYEGYILYDQVLRVWGLSLLAEIYHRSDWSLKSDKITEQLISKYKLEEQPYLSSSFYPGGFFDRFDLAAHSLIGIVLKNNNNLINHYIDWIDQNFLSHDKLPPVFYPVIHENDEEWKTLSNFHLFKFKNKPHHYHNGGIWWIWLGWLAVCLSIRNKKEILERLCRISFNLLDELGDFHFDEYISSNDLEPNGTKQLCYSASGIILLALAKENFDFSLIKPNYFPLVGEPIQLKKEYFDISSALVNEIKKENLLKREKLVVGICGESGSGKSVTARCLQIELEKQNISSVILHQDSYYKYTPKENHQRRKNDISWVGSNEVQLELLQLHIDDFLSGKSSISVPIVDYTLNEFKKCEVCISDKPILIVEGVYTFLLDHMDYKIFMERTYIDTKSKRIERSREIYDPFVEEVLQIEHKIVRPLKAKADIIIDKNYTLAKPERKSSDIFF